MIIYDKSGIEQYKNRGSFLLLFCWLLRLDCCDSKSARREQQKKKSPPPKIAALWCLSVDRSGGPVFPVVSSAGWRVCYLHTITPPSLPFHCQHSTHICPHNDGVTSTMYCCCFKKRKRDPTKKQRVNHLSPVWACALDPAWRNARDFPPVFCPYFCYWLAAAQHPDFQPLSPPPNLHPPPVQLVPRRTLRGGSAGGLVRLFLPRHPRLLWFALYSHKNRLSCGVAPFSFKSTREDSIVVVSVMACHLLAWPPASTTGAALMASSSTVAAWFLTIAHFGATVAGQSVVVLRPCSTSQCWLSIPMWNLNLQLRCIAIQKWRQQRPRICSVRYEQRWLPSFMARTTYGMFLPLRFSTTTATVSTSTTKSPMNSNLPHASVRSDPSSTALSLPRQNNAAAPISSHLNLTGHFPKAYLIGPMTGSPNHKASTCGRCSWALRWAARLAWLSIVVVKKRKTLKCYRVFKTNFTGYILKKNQNAPRPSEHPRVRGEKMSKCLGGIKGCIYKTFSGQLNGFPDGNNIEPTV